MPRRRSSPSATCSRRAKRPGTDEPDELTAFLAHAALEAGEHQAQAGADALQLMTVHSAKGLEFHTVFVSGLEEGLFPHENSLTEADGIEEERRLMYVALTRARRRLYLTYAQSRMLHGQTRYGIPSRFFHEIPEALMRRVNARFRTRNSGFGDRSALGAGHAEPVTPAQAPLSLDHSSLDRGIALARRPERDPSQVRRRA